MEKEKQALEDVPRTPAEYRQQKGPIPVTAIWLGIGLFAALVLYYFPAFIGAIGAP